MILTKSKIRLIAKILFYFFIISFFTQSIVISKIEAEITKNENGTISIKAGFVTIKNLINYLSENENIYVHLVEDIDPSKRIETSYVNDTIESVINSVFKNVNYAIVYTNSMRSSHDDSYTIFDDKKVPNNHHGYLNDQNTSYLATKSRERTEFNCDNCAAVYTENGNISYQVHVKSKSSEDIQPRNLRSFNVNQPFDIGSQNVQMPIEERIKHLREERQRQLRANQLEQRKRHLKRQIASISERISSGSYRSEQIETLKKKYLMNLQSQLQQLIKE